MGYTTITYFFVKNETWFFYRFFLDNKVEEGILYTSCDIPIIPFLYKSSLGEYTPFGAP